MEDRRDRRCHGCGHRVQLVQRHDDESAFGYRPRRDPEAVEELLAAVRATYLKNGPDLLAAWRNVKDVADRFAIEDDPMTGVR